MLGLLQLIQLILSLLCGLLFWGEVIGKALVITTILIIAAIIYRAGKIKGEEKWIILMKSKNKKSTIE